jgi:ribonuclease HII
MSNLLTFLNNDQMVEAGIDEAGRGCFISRVYAGAVFWDPQIKSELIRDSKKLTHRRRLIAYDFIKENCLSYGFGWAEAPEIDQINILNATINAMHRALDACYVTPQHIVIDGTQFKTYVDRNDQAVNYTLVTQGDDKYYSIAAASIVAKVEHDLFIEKLCDQYPVLDLYDIRSNKGYGSKSHIDAIKEHGITEFHRKTFGICKDYA